MPPNATTTRLGSSLRSFQWINTTPWLTYDSNRAAWWTLTSVVGASDDRQSAYSGYVTRKDRARSLLFHAGAQSFLGYMSHEFAHLQVIYNMGGTGTIQWSMDGTAGILPKPHYESLERIRVYTDYSNIADIAAGVNQQEINAQYLGQQVIAHNDLPPDLAMSYILNRIFPTVYVLIDKRGDQDENARFDPFKYRSRLNEWNKRYSVAPLHFEEQLFWTSSAALLSGRTIDSLFSLGSFLRSGDPHYQPNHVVMAGTRIYLPDFQMLWHPHGLFLNMILPVQDAVRVGTMSTVDAGMGVAGGFETYRFGFTHRGMRLGSSAHAPEIGVGGYYSVRPGYVHRNGYLAQASLSVHPMSRMTVEGQWQLSYYDPIEYGIKGIGMREQIVGQPVFLKSADLLLSGFLTLIYEL